MQVVSGTAQTASFKRADFGRGGNVKEGPVVLVRSSPIRCQRHEWAMFALLVICGSAIALGPISANAQGFPSSPAAVDRCARQIVFALDPDPNYTWPELCNGNRARVAARVTEMKGMLAKLRLSSSERELVRLGEIWVGAPREAAELAWGRPHRVNTTTTAAGTREQWVFRWKSRYLYLYDGRVETIQN